VVIKQFKFAKWVRLVFFCFESGRVATNFRVARIDLCPALYAWEKLGRRGSERATSFWFRTVILLFIALVLARFTYVEKLAVMF
jgi:hypothetical protein